MHSGSAGVFSALLISYPHFGVAGTTFTGERGRVPMRGCDELAKARWPPVEFCVRHAAWVKSSLSCFEAEA